MRIQDVIDLANAHSTGGFDELFNEVEDPDFEFIEAEPVALRYRRMIKNALDQRPDDDTAGSDEENYAGQVFYDEVDDD